MSERREPGIPASSERGLSGPAHVSERPRAGYPGSQRANHRVGAESGQAVSAALTITRIANSCALLDFDGDIALTDPYFTERWHLHRGEPLGMTIGELPRLSVIVVSHFFPNHWDTLALAQFANKADTPVFVPTDRMEKSARALGFERVKRATWGERHPITDRLWLDVVEAHRGPGGQVNNYVLATDDVSVFFGGEARDLDPLRSYRASHDAVDVAMLPVNGLHVAITGPQIVMNSDESVAGARVLGAHTFVPIHDAYGHDLVWSFLRRGGSAEDAARVSAADDAAVVSLATGVAWDFADRNLRSG
jgi:L-ascorbate metabolism protein UlaG (beta-lactamase superfamily)